MTSPHVLPERLSRYLSRLQKLVKIKRPLGAGTDGAVWETDRKTAIKVLEREVAYYNERDSYLRLREFGVTEQLDGFWIPQLIDYDDALWIVEMELMQMPPYIIDFGKVRIDRPPDFSAEVLQQMHEGLDEEFGAHAAEVRSLLAALESFQIYYVDRRPGNITFPDLR